MDHSSIITPGHKEFVNTRFLPKTGQTTSYATGDDGDYEKGWSIGDRFVAKNIGSDQIVFDRSTGLMWPRDFNSAGCGSGTTRNWSDSVSYCNGLNFAGYSDWRLPNVLELLSICNYEAYIPVWYSIFLNSDGIGRWTATTFSFLTDNAWMVAGGVGQIISRPKTELNKLIAVRGGSSG